jgi:hypothetical protein
LQNRSFHFHLFRKVQIRLVGQERVALALDECPIFLTDAFIFPAPNLVKVVRRVFQDLELVEHDVCLERVGGKVGRLPFAGPDVPLPSDQAPWTDIISEHFVRDGRIQGDHPVYFFQARCLHDGRAAGVVRERACEFDDPLVEEAQMVFDVLPERLLGQGFAGQPAGARTKYDQEY